MRFQCIMCFTIIRTSNKNRPATLACPNCNNLLAVPKSRFETGCVIDDFVVESLIGRGGMASVYLAKQLSMDRPVALKILESKFVREEKYILQFLKEAKAAARINHPNLVTSIAVGQEDGALFYAMEYVKGMTLGERLDKDKSLEVDEALNMIQQCAEALHAAWTHQGLIHRDIKPDNIMLADDGYSKVMDLGIAITKQESIKAEVSGTPAYMAPEQFTQQELDCRTDIYALGCTLYTSLVGYAPFDGNTPNEIGRKHIHNQLVFPERNLVLLPNRIKRLISRMMAKDPDERYHDYEELLEEIVYIRKRLAPDESSVPSVHTISFSKYRMREEMAALESPSAIFRKRHEKQKNIAIAQRKVRQESARLPWPWYYKVTLGLALLLALLVIGWWATKAQQPSPFQLRVEERLREVTLPLSADQLAQLNLLRQQNQQILAAYPRQPQLEDQLARQRLLYHNQRLYNEQTRLQLEQLDRLKRQLQEQLDSLRRERDSMSASLDQERLTSGELQARITSLEAELQHLRSIRSQQQELELVLAAQVDAAAAERQRLETRVAELETPVRLSLQWRIIEFCRAAQFAQAKRLTLVNETVDSPAMRSWKDDQLNAINQAELFYRRVIESGSRLKNQEIEQGRVLSIGNGVVKLATTQGDVTDFTELPIASLTTQNVITLGAPLWDDPAAFHEASFHFAWCWGDFKLALQLASPYLDPALLDQRIRQLLSHQVSEIETLVQANNFKLATARARIILTRYADLLQYEAIEERMRDLIRTALRPYVSSRAGSGEPTATGE